MINKKILFLDTTLHKKDATGITLSNLFGNWHKDRLFMIGDFTGVSLSKAEGYDNTYTLGNNELKHAFPLGLLKSVIHKFGKRDTIGLHYNQYNQQNTVSKVKHIHKKKKTIVLVAKSFFEWLFIKLGFNPFLFRCVVSDKLNKWISDVDPDFIYSILSTRHSILFALEVSKKLNKPLIIHIMDDWPSTISQQSWLRKYWQRVIEGEFRILLDIAYARLAISQRMAHEYQLRYKNTWEYFHNPIILNHWIDFQKKKIVQHRNPIKIGYFGRIGRANQQSIELFIKVVHSGYLQLPVEFHLYSNNVDGYENKKNVFFHSYIDASLIPSIICSYDFLLLPLSFLSQDIEFSKFSIPTKLSEYLISGVPVIVLAPKGIAVSEFIHDNNCGFCINSSGENEIIQSLNEIFPNSSKQSEFSKNGKTVALNNFEFNTVNERFMKIFNKDFSFYTEDRCEF